MRVIRTVVALGVSTAVGAMIGQASAANTATAVRCTLHTYLKDGQISSHGAIVGSVSCGHPFGKGSYSGRYRDNVTPYPFVGSQTGSSRLSFKAGTLRGNYTINRAPIAGTAPFRGTLRLTGGAGRFRHASGTLKLSCVHHVPPLTDCIVSGPVSGI